MTPILPILGVIIMLDTEEEKHNAEKQEHESRAAEIANTLEWLVIAFILAFVFRGFVMEAFRIPSGSMADTLKGAHFRLRCEQCGYRYDHGFLSESYGLPQDSVPFAKVTVPKSHCPSCGYYDLNDKSMSISNGDRILVLKCIYQFFEPKQWDVVVFKAPLEPEINFVKRLIGRPGETVEIIDGDIYINGQISRKPPKVQNELWMPVYDNDYQPTRPDEPTFNNHTWQQPFRNIANSKWRLGEENPTEFFLDSTPDKINTLVYDTAAGNDFKATYAYNNIRGYKQRPDCSDLKVRFYAWLAEPSGIIGIALSKYETVYKAWYDSAGEMVIVKDSNGKEDVDMVRRQIKIQSAGKPVLIEFANVDHQLIFRVGKEKLTFDLDELPEKAGPIKSEISPQVKILGSGKVTLSHITVFRDIHYTSKQLGSSTRIGRATQGNALTLGKDEFFVLGDNSPASHDSRWWSREGTGNNGLVYRKGVVPREYLMGKALFVYWPSGFKFPWPERLRTFLLENGPHSGPVRVTSALVFLNWIPNINQMRFIYGGSNEKL